MYNGALIPSLYREKTNLSTTSKFYHRVNSIWNNNNSFAKSPKRIFEATIQHYGIKTTQIDIVDNLWIALWFASNEFRGKTIKSNEHLFVSKSNREFGYILLVASDVLIPSQYNKGLYIGEQTELIDLRKALPSYYLRPHSQHAYMLRKKLSFQMTILI